MHRSLSEIREVRTFVLKTRTGTYKVFIDTPFGTGGTLFTRKTIYGFKARHEAEEYIKKSKISE